MEFQENKINNTFIEKSKMSVEIKQAGKGQDYINSGSGYDINGDFLYWILVLDGHGINKCIDFLKTYEWEEIILKENDIINYINNQFEKFMKIGYNFHISGSTFSLAKIYNNKIITINVGDSQVAIFKNMELEYINEKHDLTNICEKERIMKKLQQLDPISYYYMHEIVNAEKLIFSMKEYYCNYLNGNKLSMTQALGHNNYLECYPDIKEIPYDLEKDKIKIIIGSDGFWDMITLKNNINNFTDLDDLLNLNSKGLLEKTINRWRQEWYYEDINNETNKVTSEGVLLFDNIDDVSVGVYSNY